jgi:hypothetical protein
VNPTGDVISKQRRWPFVKSEDMVIVLFAGDKEPPL